MLFEYYAKTTYVIAKLKRNIILWKMNCVALLVVVGIKKIKMWNCLFKEMWSNFFLGRKEDLFLIVNFKNINKVDVNLLRIESTPRWTWIWNLFSNEFWEAPQDIIVINRNQIDENSCHTYTYRTTIATKENWDMFFLKNIF